MAGHGGQRELYACDVFPDRSRSCESADDVSLVSHAALLVIAVIGSLSVVKRFLICRAFPEDTARREIAAILFTIVLFIACVALLVNSSYNPFLYFRF